MVHMCTNSILIVFDAKVIETNVLASQRKSLFKAVWEHGFKC